MGIEEQKGQAFDAINQNATIGPKGGGARKDGGALKDFLINYCEFMRITSSWIAAAMAMTQPPLERRGQQDEQESRRGF